MNAATLALTDKEKETLRLIVRGHDAKSCARHLGLSVHTINERLREARRKLGVSSSREAARLLHEQEEAAPDKLGDNQFGEDGRRLPQSEAALLTWSRNGPQLALVAGGTIMLLSLAALAASLSAQSQPQAAPAATTAAPAAQPEATSSALRWLALVDGHRWQESWNATGSSFRKMNTVAAWQSASESGRVPLGAVLRRIPNGEESIPAPPFGYQLVRFRTTFENGREVAETLSLVREGGEWRVVGYVIG